MSCVIQPKDRFKFIQSKISRCKKMGEEISSVRLFFLSYGVVYRPRPRIDFFNILQVSKHMIYFLFEKQKSFARGDKSCSFTFEGGIFF